MTDNGEQGTVTGREMRKAQRIAARLGVTLVRGLNVGGHHGAPLLGRDGCGSYDLVLNLATESVDCLGCGATDLRPRVPLSEWFCADDAPALS